MKKKYYCIDCGKEITYGSAKSGNGRCKSCANKGERNPNFGKSPRKGHHHSEETKNKIRNSKYHQNQRGKNNPNYKDGRKSLYDSIRSLIEYFEWRNKVYKRDKYTCQECYKRDGHIHAHHKKSFAELLQEFLKYYDQFSPMEDKETLVRLAMKWQPFWDIDNGKTICYDCHNIKHPSMNFKKED